MPFTCFDIQVISDGRSSGDVIVDFGGGGAIFTFS